MAKIRTWALLAIVGVVVVFSAGWFLLLSPQKGKVAKLNDQAAAQLESNQKLASQVALLKKQRTGIPAEQAQIAAIHGRIPDTPALAAYVRWISATAAATHVDLVTIAPSPPVQAKLIPAAGAAPAPATGASATPQTPPTSNLSTITVNVTVNGDYFAIQQFLQKMEGADRATVVATVALAPGQPLSPPTEQGSQASGAAPAWKSLQAQIAATIFMSASPAAPSGTTVSATSSAAGGTPAKPSPASTPATNTAANNNAANN